MPSSLGLRTTSYAMEMGQPVAVESFSLESIGGFTVEDGYDERIMVGYVTDAAVTFDLTASQPSSPVTLRIMVDQASGYSGTTIVGIHGYCSLGTVAVDDFGSPPVPSIGFDSALSVEIGDYRDAPLVFDFDLSSFAASARAQGYQCVGLRFQVGGGARTGQLGIDGVMLLAGPAAPEPASWALMATAGATLAVARALRRTT